MKNLQSLSFLSESHLLSGLKHAVTEERKWTQIILEYLLECDRRGLHLKLGYASLHEFTVQSLGLSDGAAHRRIQSMRLMAGMPEVSEKIASGALTLSNAAKLQNYFMTEKRTGLELTREEKQLWIKKSIDLPSRSLEREILKEASAPVRAILQERTRDITPELTEIRFVVSQQLRTDLDELKNLLSHSIPDGSVTAIFERLVRQELERQRKRVTPSGRVVKPEEPKKTRTNGADSGAPTRSETDPNARMVTSPMDPESPSKDLRQDSRSQDRLLQSIALRPLSNPEAKETPRSRTSASKSPRFIPAPLKREIWNRARGQCEATVRTDGTEPFRRCSARRLLQIDHIKPITLGGENTRTNLRLLCAHHNRLLIQRKI
jgi:hypothetical protein